MLCQVYKISRPQTSGHHQNPSRSALRRSWASCDCSRQQEEDQLLAHHPATGPVAGMDTDYGGRRLLCHLVWFYNYDYIYRVTSTINSYKNIVDIAGMAQTDSNGIFMDLTNGTTKLAIKLAMGPEGPRSVSWCRAGLGRAQLWCVCDGSSFETHKRCCCFKTYATYASICRFCDILTHNTKGKSYSDHHLLG